MYAIRSYYGWPEAKKAYVAEFLEREYQIDKARAREQLFGPEPGMEEPAPEPVAGPWGAAVQKPAPARDPIDLVGPWGAVLRGRK